MEDLQIVLSTCGFVNVNLSFGRCVAISAAALNRRNARQDDVTEDFGWNVSVDASSDCNGFVVPVNQLLNIIIAILYLIVLPTYPSAYDKFLIIVGLVFNALTIWYAWN